MFEYIKDDKLVDRIVPVNEVIPFHRRYVYPFLLFVFPIWFGISLYFNLDIEAIFGSLIFILLLQGLVFISTFWSVHIKCFLEYQKHSNVKTASHFKVVPTPNNGSPDIVPVIHAEGDLCFYFQKLKYTWNNELGLFQGVSFPINLPLEIYLKSKGLEDDSEIEKTKKIYGDNTLDIVIPKFVELMMERATAPFFLFQVFCVALWCMEDYWYYSVFTLLLLVLFEIVLVKQQLKNMEEIKSMGNLIVGVSVYRNGKWRSIMSDQILVGDIIALNRSSDETAVIPVDVLLLRGSCVVNESMLTGESVPQLKEGLENSIVTEKDSSSILDIDGEGKLSVVFAGTKLIQTTSPPVKGSLKGPENAPIGYVLRTGFSTSQGNLLHTILFGVHRVTANNKETFFFILFLLMFALGAAYYVWIKGIEDPTRNRYKLFLECILILTTVIPPELPIELTLAINSSLMSLSEKLVFCTEPYRIPYGGKIDICCFDKTGTLTSDLHVVEGVSLEGLTVIKPSDLPPDAIKVLSTCHSLSRTSDGLIGDPMEKEILKSIDCELAGGDLIVTKDKRKTLMISHRFHFSSNLKRMSVIYETQEMGGNKSYSVAVKGAPEVVQKLLKNVPSDYSSNYLHFAKLGARVLALAQKSLGVMSHKDMRQLDRDEAESNLEFVGFLIISCPLKPDTKHVIKELIHSSHHVCIITGDSALTGCFVARDLGIIRKSSTKLILEKSFSGEWFWIGLDDESEKYPIDSVELLSQPRTDFCLTGEGLAELRDRHYKTFKKVLPRIKVYARVAPKEKELVLTNLNSLGYGTLMCGDGTNDVGALKHANVGVAIVSSMAEQSYKNEKKMLKKPRQIRPLNKPGRPPRNSFEETLASLEEMEPPQFVKLGDASIAAPFSAKYSSIHSVTDIIKQGRCTLVTTLQMFKILALNALVLAFSHSVLFIKGIKFSDGQATLQAFLMTMCFFSVSKSKAAKVLSKERPLPNIFNFYTICTVGLQFGVHLCCLIYLVSECDRLEPREDKIDFDKEFESNLLNSTVYLISLMHQITNFTVNYRGKPYMQSLWDNKGLLYSLAGTAFFILVFVTGIIPDLNDEFMLVHFPDEFNMTLLMSLTLDLVACYIIDRTFMFFLGEGKLKRTYAK